MTLREQDDIIDDADDAAVATISVEPARDDPPDQAQAQAKAAAKPRPKPAANGSAKARPKPASGASAKARTKSANGASAKARTKSANGASAKAVAAKAPSQAPAKPRPKPTSAQASAKPRPHPTTAQAPAKVAARPRPKPTGAQARAKAAAKPRSQPAARSSAPPPPKRAPRSFAPPPPKPPERPPATPAARAADRAPAAPPATPVDRAPATPAARAVDRAPAAPPATPVDRAPAATPPPPTRPAPTRARTDEELVPILTPAARRARLAARRADPATARRGAARRSAPGSARTRPRLAALLALGAVVAPMAVLTLVVKASAPVVPISSADASFLSNQLITADGRVRSGLVRVRDAGTAPVINRTRDAILTTSSLGAELRSLRGADADRLRSALSVERQFLETVGSVLANPRSRLRAQLRARDGAAQQALAGLPTTRSRRADGARSLLDYARVRAQAARRS